MRCPYCGGLNVDQAPFCTRCGRDLSSPPPPASRQQPQPPQRPPYQQPQPPQRPGYSQPKPPNPVIPMQAPPYQSPGRTPPVPPGPAASQPDPGPQTRRRGSTVTPPAPAPEPPAPFPPRTIAQLQALEQGALDYTQVNETVSDGRKRIVRIMYPRCTGWQQVATLLKALKQYQDAKFNTIIIQGVQAQNSNAYSYTNGQLIFDCNVRLGSQMMNRYQIETNNGFDSDSLRIVLSE